MNPSNLTGHQQEHGHYHNHPHQHTLDAGIPSSDENGSDAPNIKELNYINTEYVKDRNVSNGKKVSNTLTATKYNQKSVAETKRALLANKRNIRGSHAAKNNDNKITHATLNSDKSNLSYMPASSSSWRGKTNNNQRLSKRQISSTNANARYRSPHISIVPVDDKRNDYFVLNNSDDAGDSEELTGAQPNFQYLQAGAYSAPPQPLVLPNTGSMNANVDQFDAPSSIILLECLAGYDGGLPQIFILEAYDSRTKKLRLNITSIYSDSPVFRIDLAGKYYNIKSIEFC